MGLDQGRAVVVRRAVGDRVSERYESRVDDIFRDRNAQGEHPVSAVILSELRDILLGV